ncbi:MAG TPA: YdiU family protein [Methylocystis sp.]|nr:YdiU family protein [Methylocystis sp.]
MPVSAKFLPETLHAALGADFFDEVEPARFPKTILRYRNQRWAARVGLDGLSDAEWIAHFARFEPLPGAFQKPLALRYHGHQFRSYNPDLGDGRGFLFAQLRDVEDGRLLDLGTKGSGQTPWSRRGDGRLTLKGGVREILAAEMLEALGVDTSKSFSLIETGEELIRSDEPSPTRSSVLVRLSLSHIRIGTFQRLAYHEDREGIERLTAYVLAQYFPQLAEAERPAEALLRAVTARVAKLAASYMAAGFVHGVLNSDNINVTGESFDYGPWRFAPTWDAGFTAAYFDEIGLYAFGRQPGAIAWCLARLAECLLPLIGLQTAQRIAESYADLMRAAFRERLLFRLGLDSAGEEQDAALAKSFVDFMLASRAPFEQAFFDWRGGLASLARAEKSPAAALYESPFFAPVRAALAPYRASAHAHLDHPYFAGVEPCTMMIDEVERIWDSIARRDDWGPFEEKISQISVLREACSLQA